MTLRIRNEQISIFEEPYLRHFAETTLKLMRELYPAHFEALGEDKALERLQRGMARARKLGLEDRYNMLLFSESTFLLGVDFERHPQFEWAPEILDDVELSLSEKAKLLHARAVVATPRVD